MKIVIRNILAVIAGMFIGGMCNMALITLSGHVIPPPDGTNLTTAAGLKAAMPLLEPRHFLFPFLAHAAGSLVGGIIAARFAASQQLRLAMLIGIISLFGGIAAVAMFPAPLWFSASDLLLAYLPMAWLGYKIGSKKTT